MSRLLKGSYKDSHGISWVFQDEVETRECFQSDQYGRHREVELLHQKMVREDDSDIVDWYPLKNKESWY